jgi:hypothetical protein
MKFMPGGRCLAVEPGSNRNPWLRTLLWFALWVLPSLDVEVDVRATDLHVAIRWDRSETAWMPAKQFQPSAPVGTKGQ